MTKVIALLGTDTGVGKTTVAAGLLTAFRHRGLDVAGFKAVETGVLNPGQLPSDVTPDWRRMELASGQTPGTALGASFPLPAAPLAAARESGRTLNVKHLEEQLQRLKQAHHLVVLEGAGGLLVPFTEELLWIDVLNLWRPPCLLVARLGLGTINHSLLCLEALRRRHLEPIGLLLSATEEPGPEARHTPDLISSFGNIVVFGPMPHGCVDPGDVAQFLDSCGLLRVLSERLQTSPQQS